MQNDESEEEEEEKSKKITLMMEEAIEIEGWVRRSWRRKRIVEKFMREKEGTNWEKNAFLFIYLLFKNEIKLIEKWVFERIEPLM